MAVTKTAVTKTAAKRPTAAEKEKRTGGGRTRWRYWIGYLDTLEGDRIEPPYVKPASLQPPPHPGPAPECKVMPVSTSSPAANGGADHYPTPFWGLLCNDMAYVEWCVALNKHHGRASYFSGEQEDEGGGRYRIGRLDENGGTCPVRYEGEYIGSLWDPADMDLALHELAYRVPILRERDAKWRALKAQREIEGEREEKERKRLARERADREEREWQESAEVEIQQRLKSWPTHERAKYEQGIRAQYWAQWNRDALGRTVCQQLQDAKMAARGTPTAR